MVVVTTGAGVAVGPCGCSSTCGGWFIPGSLVGTMGISVPRVSSSGFTPPVGGVPKSGSVERALVGEGVTRANPSP